jgi:hypothetical protein
MVVDVMTDDEEREGAAGRGGGCVGRGGPERPSICPLFVQNKLVGIMWPLLLHVRSASSTPP